MNPFIDLENHYAIIDNDGKELGGNKGREYTVKAYDKDGKEKEVTIDGVGELQKVRIGMCLQEERFYMTKCK